MRIPLVTKYAEYYYLSLKENFRYRSDFFIRFFTGFLYPYAKVTIWVAIISTNMESLSPSQQNNTIPYMILVSLGVYLLQAVPISEITQRVASGEIGRDFVYPISLPISLFFQSLGNVSLAVLTTILPSLVILTLLFSPHWNWTLGNISFFLISSVIGYYIYFLINLQIDMLSFWFYETYYFHYIKDAIFSLLAGAIIPLWFFPSWLNRLGDFLPFKNILFVPVDLYLNSFSWSACIRQTLLGASWAALLTLSTYVIWQTAKKRIVVYGG